MLIILDLALRNAKNVYLEKDANTTFLWTPPLSLTTGCSFIDEELQILTQPTLSNEGKCSSGQTDFGTHKKGELDIKIVELKEDIKKPSEKYSHKSLFHRGKHTS